jgi:hypothetical protein
MCVFVPADDKLTFRLCPCPSPECLKIFPCSHTHIHRVRIQRAFHTHILTYIHTYTQQGYQAIQHTWHQVFSAHAETRKRQRRSGVERGSIADIQTQKAKTEGMFSWENMCICMHINTYVHMHGTYVMYVGSITKKQEEKTEDVFGWEYMHINTYLHMHGMYVM